MLPCVASEYSTANVTPAIEPVDSGCAGLAGRFFPTIASLIRAASPVLCCAALVSVCCGEADTATRRPSSYSTSAESVTSTSRSAHLLLGELTIEAASDPAGVAPAWPAAAVQSPGIDLRRVLRILLARDPSLPSSDSACRLSWICAGSELRRSVLLTVSAWSSDGFACTCSRLARTTTISATAISAPPNTPMPIDSHFFHAGAASPSDAATTSSSSSSS
mmetsp:Transcript_58277/g.137159  ORF Transcript_58277/g.137159 Transcript_58277/m.137159 type:complete len:220 (-) Transcript_58277:212-871(-)